MRVIISGWCEHTYLLTDLIMLYRTHLVSLVFTSFWIGVTLLYCGIPLILLILKYVNGDDVDIT
jgi:hypothetical protein